ncbi:MAG: hypothetical protein FWF06_05380 [Symbiobacteriaceae bacterium]|nr:hypothetical protein [Symbiobacteriaceae bacterium]
MNIIRTKAVELSTIPAIAYKQRLRAGGAGIRVMRLDQDASTMGLIDKRSGDVQTFHGIDPTLFPPEAFDEALELLLGLPYSGRGKIAITVFTEAEDDDVVDSKEPEDVDEEQATEVAPSEEANPELLDMTHSAEYLAIVERYSDEKGKLNYQLMNKDFIQFASKSRVVSTMVNDRALTEEIVIFIVKSRAALIAGRKQSLDDLHTAALIATLDEIDPRSTFKELRAHINRMLARRK